MFSGGRASSYSCGFPFAGPTSRFALVTTPFCVVHFAIIVQFLFLVPNWNRLLGMIPLIVPALTPVPFVLLTIEKGGNNALSVLANANLLFGDLNVPSDPEKTLG